MKLFTQSTLRHACMWALLGSSLLVGAAHAQTAGGAQAAAKYRQECAACHIAYLPGMMPAASWQKLMAGLTKHYGADASLDDATVRELSTWLGANAGTYRRVSEEPPQNRITQTAWFLRKHREGEVPADVWKRASVRSASNCMACHAGADKGIFDEDAVRIPK
jgi:nitrate/TMAO reductase-like tetraheme cytochrome c subunit